MRVSSLLLSALLALFLTACGQNEEASPAAADQPAVDSTATQASADTGNSAETTNGIPTGRLPQTVIPQHYTVDLTMNPDEPTFSGHTEIAVKITEPVDTIWLHGKDLRVSKATLKLASGDTVPVDYQQVKDFGVVKLALPQTVQPQAATLIFDYTADFSKGLLGAYRVQEDGEWYVFTQFEPTAARMVFPSFDEPAFKTPYDITITAPAGDKVVANTPQIDSKTLDNGMVQHVYATTKPLPTYLIAFAAGPLDIVEYAAIPPNDVRDHPVPLRGVTVKGKGDQIAYALENTAGIVKALENYFQIPYPYQKLDIIAVPDFGAGAMENAGAITFREVLLLIPDPENAPSWQLEAYAGVMAHELAHQWFGNLVTMPWWNDIWLNEAFATWMAAKAVESWDPSLPVKQDIASRISRAMGADSLATARQIRQPIKSHHDIHNAFDGITYSKGGSVLLMFEQYLGEETFREGIQYHLKRFANGNADVFDFLESLSHAAGKDITPAFKTFLFQAGIPLIEFDVNCDEGKPTVTLSQSRYVPLGSTANTDQQWKV
ncbi:MAG TPA: M1 family metallopeptidase, partial [Gammaproteobacteria bacterium]|nr:M1 family metallopeptidase [Gammaproteobacteria bacterium]